MIAERTWAVLRRAFMPVTAAVLILAGSVVPLPAYIELPGSAVGIPACVAVADHADARVNGDFMFTTVSQREATVFGLLLAAVADDQRVVPPRDLMDGVRRDEYLQRERQVFLDASERATIVALNAAGLAVTVRGSGAAVADVLPNTPADGVLRTGDVIIAVDGEPVMTDDALVSAIDGTTALRLSVLRNGASLTRTVHPEMRDVDGERRPIIGVRITTHDPRVDLPLDVDVASGDVGGPSAGLMLGLAIYDLVDDVDLAAGRHVAGTGTLTVDGTVGPISNIDLKVLAAARTGAQVFVAPSSQAAQARAAVPDGSDLRVIGADTFDEARAGLRRTADAASASAVSGVRTCQFDRSA